MITFAERVAQLKKRYANNTGLQMRKSKLQEFIEKAKAKAAKRAKLKEESDK
jgi:hypothetical protein